MTTEYRLIFTATFDTATERDKAYDSLKQQAIGITAKAAIAKRADMTKDEYQLAETPVTEKVI